MNANLLTVTNSHSTLISQVRIPSTNLPLLQSKENFSLLQSKGKTRPLWCRQSRHHLLMTGQYMSSKYRPHQNSEVNSLSHRHSQF